MRLNEKIVSNLPVHGQTNFDGLLSPFDKLGHQLTRQEQFDTDLH